jgi:hypothetical protein
MAMDPKQERVLRDGTATQADQPRRTDREAIRAEAEHPPVEERPRPRTRTAAVADVRVNLPSGTPVERFARDSGAERVPELGRSRKDELEAETPPPIPSERPQRTNGAPLIDRGEARRTMKARREHSKGDGNFPSVDPGPDLIDERAEDRIPRDVPKSRDDRSAPKGNTSAGQLDRNPALEARDDHEPARPRRTRPAPAASRTKDARRTKPKTSSGQATRATRKKPKATKNPQRRAAAARGSRKPATKRAVRRGGPRGGAGATRGGKR